jgi:tartrate dehydratase alpha subunit/fumarate hydratase class I-like protein
VAPETLTDLAEVAFKEISHYLRTDHLASLRAIIDDPEASDNDVFVALDLLQNAAVSAGEILPMCQDTGTAIVSAKRGPNVLTDGDDAKHLSRGIGRAYEELNLRYSQLAPTSLFEETNTGTNLPAQIEVGLSPTDDYELLFMAKGGGKCEQVLPLSGDEGRAQRVVDARIPRREDLHPGHCGLPALPSGCRHRRAFSRVHAQDREARQRSLPRRPARDR